MTNVLEEVCRENQNTYFTFISFFPENRTVYEIISKKCGKARGDTNDVTIWHISFECCISKAIRPGTRTYARARIHRQICNTYCFSMAKTNRYAPQSYVKSTLPVLLYLSLLLTFLGFANVEYTFLGAFRCCFLVQFMYICLLYFCEFFLVLSCESTRQNA